MFAPHATSALALALDAGRHDGPGPVDWVKAPLPARKRKRLLPAATILAAAALLSLGAAGVVYNNNVAAMPPSVHFEDDDREPVAVTIFTWGFGQHRGDWLLGVESQIWNASAELPEDSWTNVPDFITWLLGAHKDLRTNITFTGTDFDGSEFRRCSFEREFNAAQLERREGNGIEWTLFPVEQFYVHEVGVYRLHLEVQMWDPYSGSWDEFLVGEYAWLVAYKDQHGEIEIGDYGAQEGLYIPRPEAA
jgi:hypothetical protein